MAAAAAGGEAACEEEEAAGGRRPLPLPSAPGTPAGSAGSALRGGERGPGQAERKIGQERASGGGEVKGDEAAPAGLNWVREYFGKVRRTGGSR